MIKQKAEKITEEILRVMCEFDSEREVETYVDEMLKKSKELESEWVRKKKKQLEERWRTLGY